MKKLITLFFAALLALNVNAQAPTCVTADSLGSISGNLLIDYSIGSSQNEVWCKFIPSTTYLSISVAPSSNPNDTIAPDFNQIKIYSGTNCGNLNLFANMNIDSIFLLEGRRPSLSLLLNNLNIGNSYFVKLSRQSCLCGDIASYSLRLSSLNQNSASGNGDCVSAIQMCNNSITFSASLGFGNIYEIPAPCSYGNPGPPQFTNNCPNPSFCNQITGGCLKVGEKHSTWIKFKVASSGTMSFVLANNNLAAFFDWILYPYTNCSDISSNQVAPLRCNWNCQWVQSGGTGIGNPPFSASPCNYTCALPVTCGQEFIMCVSNFDGIGASLNFSISGVTIDCSPNQATATANPNPICPGNQTTLTATSNCNVQNWTWQPGNLIGTTVSVNPTSATTYTVIGTGANCCSGTVSAFVNVNMFPTPLINMEGDDNPSSPPSPIQSPLTICPGDDAYIYTSLPNSGYTFSWSPGNFTTNSIHVFPTATTTYTVVVTNTNGCTSLSTYTVIVDDLAFTSISTNSTCFSPCDGSICVSTLSTTGPLSYSWSPSNQTNACATGLCAGTYSVLITNGNGCTATGVFSIGSPPAIQVITTGTAICIGGSGQISVTASGGTPPYQYFWTPNNDLTSPTISNPTAFPTSTTIFTVVVTDSKGCTATGTTTVTVTPVPTYTITGSITTCQQTAQYCVNAPLNSSVTWTVPVGITYTVVSANCISVTNWGTYVNTGATISAFVNTGPNGCSNTASILVNECCQNISFPNYVNQNTQTILLNNPSAFNGTTFYINGTMTVTGNILFRECKIFLGPNAQIIVTNGATLQIRSQGQTGNCYSHLKAACQKLWAGIVVNQTATLVVFGTNNFASLIEDAEVAITSINGGDFNLRGAWFNKNHKAVVASGPSGNHPGQVARTVFTCRDLTTVLSGCPPVFSSTANIAGLLNSLPVTTLFAPRLNQRSSTGIELTAVGGFTIGQAGPNNINYFDNLDFGIVANVSNTIVRNNRFQNITGPNTFNPFVTCQVGTAVCATGTNIFNNIIVRNLTVGGSNQNMGNEFVNCYAGVVASTNLNPTVLRNNFNTIAASAIAINNCGSRTINTSYNAISNAYWGIHIYNCGAANTVVFRNTITQTLNNDNARGIHLQDITPIAGGGTIITQNNVSEMRFGIRIENKRAPQVINNNITVKNITNTNLFGSGIFTINCTNGAFLQSNHVFGYATATCPLDNGCTGAYCGNAVWWLNGIRVDMSDFADVRCNDVQDCGDGIMASGPMPTTQFKNNSMNGNLYRAFLGNWLAMGVQGTATNASDNYWNPSATFGYNLYNQNPTITNSPTVNAFRTQGGVGYIISSGNCTNYLTNQSSYIFLFLPSANPSGISCPQFRVNGNVNFAKRIIMDSVNYTTNTGANRLLNKLAIYYASHLDTALQNSTALVNFRDSLRLTNVGMIDSVYQNLTIPMDATTANAYSTINNNATTTDSITWWQKEINTIALTNVAVGSSNYTGGQLNRLRHIANQCPYIFGTAVYEARAILAGIEPFTTEYWNECELPQPVSAGARFGETEQTQYQEQLVVGKIYPNPSSGNFYFEYTNNEKTSGSIKVLNMMGEEMLALNFSSAENPVTIKTNDLANGVYFINAQLSNGYVFKQKIVLNK